MSHSSNRRMYLNSVAFAALTMGLCAPAFAQTAPADAPAAADAAAADSANSRVASGPATGPDIIVTGSSIRGAPAVGSNLISVGRGAIETNAVQTVAQLLKTVPAVEGLNAAGQGGFTGNDQSGASVPQIHGIGGANSSSTLVVIDGHRFPPTGIIRNLPDPSIIPPNAIERVEVLPEGASSVYGSDAVAGVLNFITRNKFSGLEAESQYGFADGYKMWSASLSLGKRWNDGGMAVFYSYSDRGHLLGADRPDYGPDHRALGGTNFSNFNCTPATISPAGQSLIYYYPYTTGVANASANATCQQYTITDLLPSERRHSVLVKMDQEVTDRLTLSGDMTFSTRKNLYREPVGILNGQGSTPAANLITATVFGPGSGMGSQINPFYVNPAGSTATSQTIRFDANGLFPNGARYSAMSETFYGHAQAEYKINDNWRATAFVVAGVNTGNTVITGGLCTACLLLALNGSVNSAGNQAVTAIPGQNVFVSQALTAANALDVWNPLSSNRTNAAVLQGILNSRSELQQRQVSQQYNINVNGKLFTLPGGDMKIALGGEVNKLAQTAKSIDSNGTGGASTGSNFVAVQYSRTVASAYGELLIPLISESMNIPLVNKFVVNISGRYDHYNEFGNITNPKYAFSWDVIHGVKIRGNYATAFVAPNFSTYGPDQLTGTFGKSVDSYFGPQSSVLALNLNLYPEARTLPGCTTPGQVTCNVGPGTAANGMATQGANPNVKPATGNTWGLGTDLTPVFLPGFKASFTYWHTTLTGGVGAPSASLIQSSPLFHNLITIYPNGATAQQIADFQGGRRQNAPLATGAVYFGYAQANQNIYNLQVEGIDFDINYRHHFNWGTISGGIAGTYKTRFDENVGGGTFSVLNKEGINGTFPSNRIDGRANLDVTVGPVEATMYVNYTGSFTYWGNTAINPVVISGTLPVGGGDHVGANTTVDFNLQYDLSKIVPGKTFVYVNIENAFNKFPPFVNSAAGYDTFLAFPMGRLVTFGIRTKF